MNLISQQITDHITSFVPPRPQEMQKMEADASDIGFPIIGPAAGQMCYQIARMIGARKIFELGSGYGYSTAWFARAVKENGGGEVHHVVWDEDLSRRAKKHLTELGHHDLIQYHIAEAVQTLRDTPGPFDLIFNDIEKEGYPASLPVIKEKLRPGGVLIIDNMLWSGRIFDEDSRDPHTEGVREISRLFRNDSDWIVTLVPIRDGLIVAVLK